MKKIKLTREMQKLSLYVYDHKQQNLNGWVLVDKTQNSFDGFSAETFRNLYTDEVAIVFCGTEIEKSKNEMFKDVLSDIFMGVTLPPLQIINAYLYYNNIRKKFPNSEILLTGHSLGGSLAQLIGSETNEETITFGAYGTKNLLNYQVKFSDNIVNYGNIQDPIFIMNIDNQIGQTLVIDKPNKKKNKYLFTKTFDFQGDNNIDIRKHFLEEMGDVSDAIEYKKMVMSIKIMIYY